MAVRRHFWIFLIALLLPFAQVAAAAHEVSHVETALETGSKSGLHVGHCDMCALAAQINGGGAASVPVTVPHFEMRQIAPICPLVSQSPIAVVTGFDSRAPPNSSL